MPRCPEQQPKLSSSRLPPHTGEPMTLDEMEEVIAAVKELVARARRAPPLNCSETLKQQDAELLAIILRTHPKLTHDEAQALLKLFRRVPRR
jgi:hypothetical protein